MPKLQPRDGRLAQSATAAAMRQRYDDFDVFLLTEPAELFREFPTTAERMAFAEAFPEPFYRMWRFFADDSDGEPRSVHYHFRVFRRPADEFLALIERKKPAPFAPPDLRGVHFYPESIEALALARGEWWRANKLPMTDAERAWLDVRTGKTATEVTK